MVQRKSPFPTGFLGVDLSYSGAWQSLGTDLDQSGVAVSHGSRSEGGNPDVSSLSFTVKNGDGKYSPRNPNSPLYGLIGQNTPARATLALGANWLDIKAVSNSSAYTPDAAALDITGDIDIRWHGYMESWNLAADLMSKYDTSGNQRSWILRAEADGKLTLFWSVTGSSTLREARSTVAIPAWAGEIALRVTLDVDNGSGGCTARFYYSGDLDGTWTQLGPDVVAATTTSIFNSTAQLRLGKAPTSSANWPAMRVYGWELRAGIGGAIRSSGRTADLAEVGFLGTFTDTTGLVWTLAGTTQVTNRHTIAAGEVAEWPVEWNRKGAPSVLTQVQASGVTRRLGQGQQPVQSPIYRTITSSATDDLKAYWPMEEPEGSTAFGWAVAGRPGRWSGSVPQLASSSAFGGSRPLPVLGTSQFSFDVPPYVDTNTVQVRFLVHAPTSGWTASQLAHVRFEKFGLHTVSLYTGATVGTMRFLGRDVDGSTAFDTGYLDWDLEDKPARASIRLTQNGSATDWRVSLDFTDASGLELTGSVASTSFGRCTAVMFNLPNADMNVAVGHLTVQSASTSPTDIPTTVLNGYLGEGAQSRQVRLAGEHSVDLIGRGNATRSIPMGTQPASTFLEAVREAAGAEGGILYDDMASVALHRRALHSMGSQPPVVIPYTDNRVIPFTPVDDDGLTRNRITVSSQYALNATVEQVTGAMSIDSIGLYDDELSLNIGSSAEVQRRADWELHVGTWDEGRYPTMGVDLANPYFMANPELTRKLLAITPGDRMVIEDPPSWLPPRSVDVLVMGIQMVVTPLSVKLTWTCVPARPYHYGYYNHTEHRYSGEGTVLTAALPTAPTSALILTGGTPGRASTPDSAALDIVGDLDVRAYVALADWTPAATTTIAGKFNGTGSQRSWRLNVTTAGRLQLTTSSTGVGTQTNTGTASVPALDGEGIWVRATLDVDNGAGSRVYTYYTSADGVTWTQLGSTSTISGATSIFSSTASLEVGSSDNGTSQLLTGLVASLEVRNGINGTIVANPNFATQAAGATSFTDGVGNVWTVHSPASIGSVQLSNSFGVTPPFGVEWTHADGDYDIVIGGEVMTVTNVVGNTMTVVRSVNGVVKAHPASSSVSLAEPSFYAR